MHALGLALAAGPERWTAMEGGCPVLVDGQCIGGIDDIPGVQDVMKDIIKEAEATIKGSVKLIKAN